jgi:hypothetical protein
MHSPLLLFFFVFAAFVALSAAQYQVVGYYAQNASCTGTAYRTQYQSNASCVATPCYVDSTYQLSSISLLYSAYPLTHL